MKKIDYTKSFTLVELLIVVAIIAVVAAIAVPNLLEAQTRSKVSRAQADLRSFGTAIEAYAVDNNFYPQNETFLAPKDLVLLTTPVSYLSSVSLRDPFGTPKINVPSGETGNEEKGYSYLAYNTDSRFYDFEPAACSAVPFRGWSVVSQGPNQNLDGAGSLVFRNCPFAPDAFLEDLAGRIYDSTNGTTSRGDIIRFGGETPAKVIQGVNEGG
jgi:prepilin-type N-terminal cleavage/methylation domain-containing protein